MSQSAAQSDTVDRVVAADGVEPTWRFGIGPLAGIVITALAISGGFIIEGGDLTSLILPSPLLIVVVGTIGMLLVAHPAADVGAIPSFVWSTFGGQRSLVGAHVLRDAALYAIATGLIALLLAFVVVFGGMGSPSSVPLGHALGVSMAAPLYGLGLGLLLHAFSRRLRPHS